MEAVGDGIGGGRDRESNRIVGCEGEKVAGDRPVCLGGGRTFGQRVVLQVEPDIPSLHNQVITVRADKRFQRRCKRDKDNNNKKTKVSEIVSFVYTVIMKQRQTQKKMFARGTDGGFDV